MRFIAARYLLVQVRSLNRAEFIFLIGYVLKWTIYFGFRVRKLLKYVWLAGHEQGQPLLAHAASASLEPIRRDQVSPRMDKRMQCRDRVQALFALQES